MTGASRIWPWLALVLALLLALQTQWLAKLEVSQSKQVAANAQQSQAATEKKAVAVLAHGAAQQENTHAYTQEMARLQAGRAADAIRIAGLRNDISSAATRNVQLVSDAAACRDLANRHENLATLAGERGTLVAELVGLVRQRDAEIGLLLGQVAIDRQLLKN